MPSTSSLLTSVPKERRPFVETCSLFVVTLDEGVLWRLKAVPERSVEFCLFALRSLSTVEEVQPDLLGNAFAPPVGVEHASEDLEVDAICKELILLNFDKEKNLFQSCCLQLETRSKLVKERENRQTRPVRFPAKNPLSPCLYPRRVQMHLLSSFRSAFRFYWPLQLCFDYKRGRIPNLVAGETNYFQITLTNLEQSPKPTQLCFRPLLQCCVTA